MVGCEIADIASAHGQHVFSQQGKLIVHHFLNYGCRVNARQVVIFKSRHEGNCACCDDHEFGIHVINFFGTDVFHCNAFAFEHIPNRTVEENAFMAVAGKCFGNIETTHSAEFLFLFEKEKLVRLHQKLSANLIVIVYHQVINTMFEEFFTTSKPCRSGANNGNCGFVNVDRGLGIALPDLRGIVVRNFAYFMNTINLGDANAANLSINQHFAGAAFANAAFKAALAVGKTMAVYRVTGLVQGGGNGESFFSGNGFSIELKGNFFAYRNFEDWVNVNFIHTCIK